MEGTLAVSVVAVLSVVESASIDDFSSSETSSEATLEGTSAVFVVVVLSVIVTVFNLELIGCLVAFGSVSIGETVVILLVGVSAPLKSVPGK